MPPWPDAVVEAVCAVLAATEWPGLFGSEIGRLLEVVKMNVPSPRLTKRHRLYNAMASRQNSDQSSRRLRTFVVRALDPARFIDNPDRHAALQQGTNEVLSMVGLRVNDKGDLMVAPRASSLDEVAAFAGRLQTAMRRRAVHTEVYRYCGVELLRHSVFHAVFEATKKLAQRLRDITGSTLDGAELVEACFIKTDPAITINAHLSKSDLSEHSGYANMLRGIFGTFRDPVARTPNRMVSQRGGRARSVPSMLSYAHRRLDLATVRRRLG
ncbi:MAG TPA: TIGR02391 family protein [Propionibacteriaceae bacterium]|jgi:uncharacterized protein (TIGR02391 family)